MKKSKKIKDRRKKRGNVNVKHPFGHNLNILFDYLKYRAKIEGEEFKLEISFFNSHFDAGCRSFFGVFTNSLGFPLWDEQEPEVGYLNNFLCWFFLSKI